MRKEGFWAEFLSSSNETVNTSTVLVFLFSVFLSAPIVGFSLKALYFHIFTLRKGLDGPSVQLLIALLTAATGSLGGIMYSRTLGGLPPGWTPPPIKKKGE